MSTEVDAEARTENVDLPLATYDIMNKEEYVMPEFYKLFSLDKNAKVLWIRKASPTYLRIQDNYCDLKAKYNKMEKELSEKTQGEHNKQLREEKLRHAMALNKIQTEHQENLKKNSETLKDTFDILFKQSKEEYLKELESYNG